MKTHQPRPGLVDLLEVAAKVIPRPLALHRPDPIRHYLLDTAKSHQKNTKIKIPLKVKSH